MTALRAEAASKAGLRRAAFGLAIAGALGGAPSWSNPGPADAHALGVEEARLNYCTKVDPKDAPRLREHIRRITVGESAEAVETARRNADYRKGYEAETQFIAAIDERNASRICSVQDKHEK